MSENIVPNADRNLLFGILAVQMDFISRDALIQSMNTWVLAKHRSLGDILQDQGALKNSERTLLEALVEKHLERHRNDARQSLAAVASQPRVHDELAHIKDGDVQASLSDIFSTRETVMEPTTAEIPDGRSATRYRVLRPHAKGGLGEVFVALDQELNREVALKEIQEKRSDDPQSRGRFLLEAEITGGLEHPGVVPVYGLGQYADGRPYYAMRLIRGESLQAAIRRYHEAGDKASGKSQSPGVGEKIEEKDRGADAPRSLEFELRALLTRFVAVCNTIAYAHSRGVLHRDIKPSNIMLGKYGETLVIDWGLAKAVGRPDVVSTVEEVSLRPASGSGLAATQAGSAVGTPAFMSPEQAAGKRELVGPSSDVYGLGATLYVMLTGHAPFRGSEVADIVARVQRGEWRRPRDVNPQTPFGLDAICRKAMALSPADRYATALELAADVEHWLADEPISASSEPRGVRLGRWMRRHRAGVVGAVAALIAAVLCLGASTGLLLAANREAEQQRKNAEFQSEEAQRQEAIANDQRDRAAARFQMAGEVVYQFQTKVGDSKDLKSHGLESLRRKLLEQATIFYKKLVAEEASDLDVQAEQGRAHYRLAVLSASLGDTEDSRRNDEAALAIFQRLSKDYPEQLDYRYELVLVYNNVGMMHHRAGRSREAKEAWQKSLELCRPLVEKRPANLKYQDKLATIYNNLGSLHYMNSEFKAAETAYDEVLKACTRLVQAEPSNPDYQLAYGDSFSNLGLLYTLIGRNADAEKAFESALAIQKQLHDDHPREADYQLALARSYNSLGSLYSNTSRPLLAIKPFEQAREMQQKLIAAHPLVIEYQLDLVASHNNLGDSYCDIGRLEPALASYKEGEKLSIQLVQAQPENLEFAALLAGNEAGQALLLGEGGKLAESLSQFEKAIGRLDAILRKEPKQVWATQYLSDALLARAQVRAKTGKTTESEQDLERNFKLVQAKDNAKYQTAHAAVLVRAGKHKEALAEADAVAKDSSLVGRGLYSLAGVYAIAAAKDAAQAVKAVRVLERARDAGYFQSKEMISRLKNDSDLSAIQEREEFKQFLASVEKKN
jgi:serine/threonine-protein kinase